MKINGTPRSDTLIGSDQSDLLAGKGGNDIIFGYLGDDRLWGGAGDDYIDGGEGYDQIRGRDGDDFLVGGDGYAFITGDRGNDTIIAGQNYSEIYGGDGNDALVICHGQAAGGAGDDFFDVSDWDDLGWQGYSATDPFPVGLSGDPLGPTYIDGGEGRDAVQMAFRLGETGITVRWTDYTPDETLTLLVFNQDGTLLMDDAATKAWLDTSDDGMLSDADGDGGWLDVAYDATANALTIQIQNDAIVLRNFYPDAAPIDHLFI